MKIKTLLLCVVVFVLKTNAQTVTDYDGNVYNTVDIGTQKWMAENLKTTTFNTGDAIPISISSWNNTTPNYCWYLNDQTTYSNPYGALYNWYAVGTGNLCPTGWHVPTDEEWTTLGTFLGGNSIAGEKLKEVGNTHWTYYMYAVGSNTTGFNGVPGGTRGYGSGVSFMWKGDIGGYWTATENPLAPTTQATIRGLNYNSNIISVSGGNKKVAYSVRCMNNNLNTGVEENKTLDNFVVSPNPATDGFYINVVDIAATISLYDLSGRTLLTQVLAGNAYVNISQLDKGVYVAKISTVDGTFERKIVKK
jgi:uncharacterized protein (TIGR02145 family)